MAVIALREKPKKENYRYQPFVSIIVPIYNEEKVIEKRIKNLMGLDYPKDKYEIIIIESGSIDNTYNVAKKIVDYIQKSVYGF
jgi:cellulose synthase/poly-beta-1,6-N-acetylglucosamine synthase-like glycosyltransferase